MFHRLIVAPAAGASLAMLTLAARAAGDSGTGSVGEMTLTGGQLALLFGGAGVLGIVIWLVIRFLNRK